MSESRSKHSLETDRNLVALKQKHETDYWMRRYGVHKEDLTKAVRVVGHGAAAVHTVLRETPQVMKRVIDGLKSRVLNWQPDLPDFRDHMYALQVRKVEPIIDLRSRFWSSVEDQGNLGSCTGNAFAGNMEFLQDQLHRADVSRLFIYYGERALEGSIRSDSGAYIRDGIKTLAKIGVCSEKLWPYNVAKFKNKPSAAAFKDAATRKIREYQRINDFNAMKDCLASGFPFVFGFTVYDSFMTDKVAQSGLMPMPNKTEQVVGGHAVLAVGYDDTKQLVTVRNSWGELWGDHGYFYMPYAYIADKNLCDDMWTIRA